jgi:predicted hotdog family 3-hydroxylacyl-ACP dehydratase
MSLPLTLDREGIARLIPHQGSMCLLDHMAHWSEAEMVCHTHSHQLSEHPLRAHGRLSAAHAIEYAAQAMALHSRLKAEHAAQAGGQDEPPQRPRKGFLAAVRAVRLEVPYLDDLPAPLEVRAHCSAGDERQAVYTFSVGPVGLKPVVSGRATVVLDAEALVGSGAGPALG